MFRKFPGNKKSIAFTWYLSLISILLIIILINTTVYINAEKTVKDEINRSNTYILELLKSSMDKIFNDIDRLNTDIIFNNRISSFIMLYDKDLTANDRYNANRIIKDLRTQRLLYNSVDYFFLYFPNTDIILTSDFITDSKTYYNEFCATTEEDYEKWKSDILNNPPWNHLYSHRKNAKGEDIKTITFTTTLPINKLKTDAVFVVMVDEESLLKQIKNIDIIDNNWFFIINREKQVLLSNEAIDLPQSLSYELLSGIKDTISDCYVQDEQTILSYITSENGKFKYLSVIPTRVFWEKLHYIRITATLNILICVLLGAVLLYIFVKRSYNPIDKIVKVLKAQFGNEISDINEYSFIEKSIKTTLGEKQELISKIQMQNTLIRDNILLGLLKGRLEGKIPVEDSLASFDIEFISNYFLVMVFKIEDINLLFAEDADLNLNQRIKLVKIIMANIVEELIRQNNRGFMIEIDGMMVCLVNFKEDNLSDWRQEILKVVKESQIAIKNHFNICFTVAVSGLYSNIEEAPQSFQEALYAMEYKVVMGVEETIFYDDIGETNQAFYYYPFNIEQKIVNFVKSADYENSKKLVEKVLDKNFDRKDMSPKIAKHLMFNLINTIIRAINEIRSNSIDNYEQYLDKLDNLLDCDNTGTMHKGLLEIIEVICNNIKKDKEKDGDDITKETIKFIGGNYYDSNLSITLIGGHLNLTPYYVSKLFKERTGESLQEYINKYRIEKAKELLSKGGSTIKQVSQQVGYTNIQTFTRVFKKYEGVPPGKYKNISERD